MRMKSDATPSVHSFIVRFVVEDASDDKTAPLVYHGAIRHIQSAEEINFGTWQEAVEFISQFVPLEETDKP